MFLRNNGKAQKIAVIFLVFLFVSTLFSSFALAANSRVDVFGFVRDDENGNPIYNARIDLFYDRDSVPFTSVFSDSGGKIDQPVYAAGNIKRIEITRSGYKKAVYTAPNYSRTLDLGTKYLVAGVTRENVYTVYGDVLDDRDDAPLFDAKVVLVDEYDDIAYTGYTNARGYFEVVNLPLSDYEVFVTKYGYRDYEMKNLLRLRSGDYDLGKIRLEKTGGTSAPAVRTLTGRITDEDGYYVQGAEVYLLAGHSEEIKTKTDARGYYTFRDLEAKTYTIGVNAAGYELLERMDFIKISAGDLEREVNLMVRVESRTGYDVYGSVVDENRKYLADVEVSLIDGNTRIKRVLSDAQGYYEFRYVPDGRYTLEFKKLGFQTQTLGREIRVEGSYYPVPQTALREKRGSTSVVGGLVGDSQSGLSNITTYLEGGANSYSAQTNYFGFFTFNDVKEGSYKLYATINNSKKLLESNIRVAGSRLDIGDININRVDSGYKISGNIKDADNFKLHHVKVTVTAGGTKKETFTDSSGNYILEGLARGAYTLTVSKEGYSYASEKIDIFSYDLEKNFILRPNDYIKVQYAPVSLAVNERVNLDKFISKVEIFSARGALLDNITSRYEITVPSEYTAYLTAHADHEIRGVKTGEAYLEVSIRNSREYDQLLPALLKVTITAPVLAREAILTIGTNKYTVDGQVKIADAVPYIKEGRSFFSIRVMAGVLGVTEENIKWDADTKTVTLLKGDQIMGVTMGKNFYYHNGITKPMDVQAENVKNRIYLPARYVTESLGGQIEWDEATKMLVIRSN
ncbi:MAG: hypothetical protein GX334_00960 [Firmicutes bacterium]|nr:hypothetical protein [Bacillota bacterium]